MKLFTTHTYTHLSCIRARAHTQKRALTLIHERPQPLASTLYSCKSYVSVVFEFILDIRLDNVLSCQEMRIFSAKPIVDLHGKFKRSFICRHSSGYPSLNDTLVTKSETTDTPKRLKDWNPLIGNYVTPERSSIRWGDYIYLWLLFTLSLSFIRILWYYNCR